jgi:hypothetical protein
MIKVKKILGDDIFGLWHVKQIIVNKNGQRFSFAPDPETFCSKQEAELHAHDRTRYFLQRKLGVINADILRESQHSWKSEGVLAKAIKFLQRLGRNDIHRD